MLFREEWVRNRFKWKNIILEEGSYHFPLPFVDVQMNGE